MKNLSNLAAMIGVGGIWIKDESARLDLRSFKVLGAHLPSIALSSLLSETQGNTDPNYFRRVVWEGIHPVPELYR